LLNSGTYFFLQEAVIKDFC